MAWKCDACGLTEPGRARPEVCDRCGVEGAFSSDSPVAAAAPRARARPASELLSEAPELAPTGDRAADRLFGGGLARGSALLVWGRPGTGKSTLLYRLATGLGPALAVCPEMSGPLAAMTAQRGGADLARLRITGEVSGWRRELEAFGGRALVLDSVSVAPRPLALLRELYAYAQTTGVIVLAIAHVNKRGRPLGPASLENWPDYCVKLQRARQPGRVRAVVEKSRYCPTGAGLLTLCPAPVGPQPERRAPALRLVSRRSSSRDR